MEETDLSPLVAKLNSNVSDLEEALSPLLKQALSEQARQLPLLDRAKLYAHVVYAIESLLFCRCTDSREQGSDLGQPTCDFTASKPPSIPSSGS